MKEYIERADIIPALNDYYEPIEPDQPMTLTLAQIAEVIENIPAADVAPVVHGLPVLRYRPERHEWYEATGLNKNGEPLYVKRVRIDEKSWATYCPACGKRLCSRFNNYCPHCGAKMDGGKNDGKT